MKAKDLTRAIADKLGIQHLELGAGAQLQLMLDTVTQIACDERCRPLDVRFDTRIAVCPECGRWNYHRANCTRRPMP